METNIYWLLIRKLFVVNLYVTVNEMEKDSTVESQSRFGNLISLCHVTASGTLSLPFTGDYSIDNPISCLGCDSLRIMFAIW